MYWLVIAAILVVGIVVTIIMLTKRRAEDLGSVSDHWIAQNRVGLP